MLTGKLREKLVGFVLGVLTVITLLLLTGAVSSDSTVRYQMETVVRNNVIQIYVMETATGRVKWVDKMNVPFEAMQGD
jgi:heme/copper-type cytochrome/quinol oxidase subunit 4